MLKQLFAKLKIFQCSIFQRNTILLEIVQSKQKPSTTEFSLPPNKLVDKNISKINESITSTNFIFIQAANAFCMNSHWFAFITRTPESISNPTSVFFWIWWFFSCAVFIHGLFWNTGFTHVRFQLCKVRQVFIIWSFIFLSPTIFIFRSTIQTFLWWNLFYLQNLFWTFWVYLKVH